jgi:hypothetical protein
MLRRERRGALLADGTPHQCDFVCDDETGRPVTNISPGALDADEHVLFVPDEGDGALQLLTIPERIDADSACADRWRAYFGDPDASAFVRFAIDCARLEGEVIDGEKILTPNALKRDVARVCKALSARVDEVRALARRRGAKEPAPGLIVGVDQGGFDIKTKFDVLRLEFEREAVSGDSAIAMIEAMLR